MMTREEALRFAEGWGAAWNAHDLDRILAHYSDEFEMTTPFIVKLMDEPTGTLTTSLFRRFSAQQCCFPDRTPARKADARKTDLLTRCPRRVEWGRVIGLM
jgi:hypothetical protein